MINNNFFTNRKLVIATKHNKEQAIAPILEKHLLVNCITPENLDTDQLGTFSGEIERILDPLAAARQKCYLAMELTNTDLAVASEGSFGAHPLLYFLPADDELILLVDKKNNLEIVVREISTKTNFNGKEITTQEELLAFAQLVYFPSHALIIKNKQEGFTAIEKGIINLQQLQQTFQHYKTCYGKVFVETDMRAMHNPTRMGVIAIATNKLVQKLAIPCPHCAAPGFGIIKAVPGLPCEFCKTPTKSTLYYLYNCQKCKHSKEVYFPKAKECEEQMYCDRCNP